MGSNDNNDSFYERDKDRKEKEKEQVQKQGKEVEAEANNNSSKNSNSNDNNKRSNKRNTLQVVHKFCLDPLHPNVYLPVRELAISHAEMPFGQNAASDSTGLGIWAASVILARWL